MNIKAPYLAPLLIAIALITASCTTDRPSPPPPSRPAPKPRPPVRPVPPERPRTLETLIGLSPTLTADLEDLKHAGWKIIYDAADLPRAYEGDTKLIAIPKKVMSDPDAVILMLAHEVGHAKSGINADPSWMTLEVYVDAKLRGEGAAVLKTIQVQRESRLPFKITAGWGNHDNYYDIYEALISGEISESEARRQIGEIYRNGEYIDFDRGMSYGKFYENQWHERQKRRWRSQ
jgi:hypothetical protein